MRILCILKMFELTIYNSITFVLYFSLKFWDLRKVMAGNGNDYVLEQMKKYDISQTYGFLMDKQMVSRPWYV